MAATPEADAQYSQAYLPDFCAPGTILVILLVAELVAIVLSLAAADPGAFLTELSKVSMYLLWLALLGTALMCRIRPWAEQQGNTQAFVVCFVLLEVMCLLLAEITYQLTVRFGAGTIIDGTHGGFLVRTFAISSIVIALAMRYLYVASEWRRSIVLEAQARISALQALIRPHFLFNSMNTIAALTRSDPRLAEEAVEDLSGLLRANLNATNNRTTLEEEIEVATIYQRIEKLRLGDRLDVMWTVDDLPLQALIPSLTIQPLLENAIYHGIEMLPEGGTVTVTGRRDADSLTVEIHNPLAPNQTGRAGGHQMALSNIRQRFELAYGNRAGVEVQESASDYRVLLRFPFERESWMNVLIVDDEAPARDRLRRLLEEDGDHTVAGEAANGQQALDMVAALAPDVVLLDIRMPGLSGLETAQHLNAAEKPPAIVFATAYDEYAIDAFEANAIGYILKPVRRERLNQALELASRLSTSTLDEVKHQPGMEERRGHLCTRSHGDLKLIPIEDVFYVLADQKYVNVTHQNGQDLIDDSLKALEEEFPDVFVRIHRGALVAVSCIDSLKKTADAQTQVALRGVDPHDADRLIVSRRHLTNVKRRLRKG